MAAASHDAMERSASAREGFEEEPHPYKYLEKMSVVTDCRVFHDATFVRTHPKRCCQLLTKLMWFLCQGEDFSGPEAVEVFFGVTKLFQSTDGNLRRLVYLFLRWVATTTARESVIIVTQSLVKDMLNEVPLYKANALRVLGAIVDGGMLGQLERYFKQMIVDRDDYTASAALVTSLTLSNDRTAAETIARWVNEVQTVLTTRMDMVQFHALALLRNIKRNDRLAVSKVVVTLMRGNVRSPLALCLLIRYAITLVNSDSSIISHAALVEFLEQCMRHKNDMVALEAARALCSVPDISASDLRGTTSMLQSLLSSTKPALRFAGVRTLAKLALIHPRIVVECTSELESLVMDSNRTIAMLAITTLLQTVSETTLDRLMKQINAFVAEVSNDELKVGLVQGIHKVALRLPTRWRSLLVFLSNSLREEGGYEFKRAILDAILDIMDNIPESENEALSYLCEFIEDCEFTSLATRVLHLLGDKGPSAPNPGAFIRYIYNRVILENAPIRAAAATTLAKFATRVPELRPSITPLLMRCLDDDDDEVRDRATLYLKSLEASSTTESGAHLETLTSGHLPMPVASLSKALALYSARPAPGAFSFDSLPRVEVATATGEVPTPSALGFGYASEVSAPAAAAAAAATHKALGGKARAGEGAGASAAASEGDRASHAHTPAASGGVPAEPSAAEALYKIPEFASYGSLFRSSKPVDLTEAELEYVVSVQKHIFEAHVVFAFTIRNTLPDILLERATVAVTCSEPTLFRQIVSISAPRVREGTPAVAYAAFKRNEDEPLSAANFTCALRFQSRECDASTGEPLGPATPETLDIDDVPITLADFVASTPLTDFRRAWEGMGADNEVVEEFVLPHANLAEVVNGVVEQLGMAYCEGTGLIKPGATKHVAFLSGVFLGGIRVLARLQIMVDAEKGGSRMKLGIRSEAEGISDALIAAVA